MLFKPNPTLIINGNLISENNWKVVCEGGPPLSTFSDNIWHHHSFIFANLSSGLNNKTLMFSWFVDVDVN